MTAACHPSIQEAEKGTSWDKLARLAKYVSSGCFVFVFHCCWDFLFCFVLFRVLFLTDLASVKRRVGKQYM